MKIHLVSYATPKYRHRQMILAASASANGVVETATSWTLSKLRHSEFGKLAPNISLAERGSGFWAWKPFIILKALESLPDGEVVFYCDVGRKYPYILLEHALGDYVKWMEAHQQDIMPGVMIPWNGPMEIWTKHDAFSGTGLDGPEIRSASPIQASFSLWKVSPKSRAFLGEWLSACLERQLVSDDPSETGPEAPVFRSHRHDQSLLTLCCLKHRVQGIDLGSNDPTFNERDPGQVAEHLFSSKPTITPAGRLIRLLVAPVQVAEQALRERIRFGKNYE